MKVLIVDDDRFLTQRLDNTLTKHGYDVTIINKANELNKDLNVFEKHDVILLDLMMRKPEDLVVKDNEETGEAIYRLIKQKDKNKPVVVITGKDKSDIVTRFDRDNTKVLLKPFNQRYEDLYEAIESV